MLDVMRVGFVVLEKDLIMYNSLFIMEEGQNMDSNRQ